MSSSCFSFFRFGCHLATRCHLRRLQSSATRTAAIDPQSVCYKVTSFVKTISGLFAAFRLHFPRARARRCWRALPSLAAGCSVGRSGSAGRYSWWDHGRLAPVSRERSRNRVGVRRRSVLILLTIIAAAAAAYVARRPLLTAVGGFLVLQEAPSGADAIVVLSGSVPDRILEAADLYHAHLAPRLVLTREVAFPGLAALRARGINLPEHHEQNRSIAEQLGVPAAALSVMDTPTSSTITEAAALIDYLREQRIGSILLVTSKAHARRAAMIFRHLAGQRLQITVCPSPYDPFPADAWWQHRAYVRRVVIEYGKLLNYLLVDRWRKTVTSDE
jgi:uncharacterized SAM-binding protein YcdF (DUF218 family)